MIGDFFFFIKMIFMSLFFVLLLQIKIGDNTLEEKIKLNVQKSALIVHVQEVAHGGVKVIEQTWKSIMNLVGHKIDKSFDSGNIPGQRSLNINLQRSKKFLSEQLEKAKTKAEQSEAIKSVKNKAADLDESLRKELEDEGFYIDDSE